MIKVTPIQLIEAGIGTIPELRCWMLMEAEQLNGVDRFSKHPRSFGNCCDPLTIPQIKKELHVLITDMMWLHEFGSPFVLKLDNLMTRLPDDAGELIPLPEAYLQFAQYLRLKLKNGELAEDSEKVMVV